MTEKGQIYRCDVCENIVNVFSAGAGNLVCCEVPMKLLEEKIDDEGYIKHRPVIEKLDASVKIKVGEVPHPMEDNHFIEWIEIKTGKQTFIEFLSPGDEPVAEFPVNPNQEIKARSYCNIHGLWRS